MIPPEVPTGGAGGQRVLDNRAYGPSLGAAGVQALRRREVVQVGGEATAAAAAARAREGNHEGAGPRPAGIAEVREAAWLPGVAAGTPAPAWAGARGVVARAARYAAGVGLRRVGCPPGRRGPPHLAGTFANLLP